VVGEEVGSFVDFADMILLHIDEAGEEVHRSLERVMCHSSVSVADRSSVSAVDRSFALVVGHSLVQVANYILEEVVGNCLVMTGNPDLEEVEVQVDFHLGDEQSANFGPERSNLPVKL
jgi:hypothetical protein